ncbi:HMG box protein [Sclerotinia borealis F-4128]|uniref:HMG box protein n=1 Tax=Sclerotinia borealis (strain F-4128) TaxID=1432307 RepID=W9CMA3_SCLBF|nr:HMG box protein [Sclerotinia borealis F-4128]
MDLEPVLNRLEIQCYLQRFKDAGFDTWDALKDITETDMEELGMKLGHRRVRDHNNETWKLQREIATSRGWPPNAPLEAALVCCCGSLKKGEQKVTIMRNENLNNKEPEREADR